MSCTVDFPMLCPRSSRRSAYWRHPIVGSVTARVSSSFTTHVGVAFGTGVTGALIYLNLLRISPDAGFSINWTAYTIFIVVIGGLGSLEGPLVGTALFFLVRELLSDYGAWYMIFLGALAVGVMLAYPRGLWGLAADRWDVHVFPVQRRVRVERN